MNFRDTWLRMKRAEREALAEKVGTTYKYLQKLSGGFAVPSMAMAQRIKDALGKRLDIDGFMKASLEAGNRRRKP
jgi:hypothetical protein